MDKIALARRLRRDQTLAEKAFWTMVRNRHLGGYRFLRQAPIGRYIADFVCEAGKLIVELDGPVHDDRTDHDARRAEVLELYGYTVLRLRNEQVLADPGGTMDAVLAALRSGRV
jgi:very-short-patch-repair endonuclease